MSFFALLFHVFDAHIVHLSLLSSLNRLDKPHTSFPPNIQAHTMSNPEKAAQQKDRPKLAFTAWTEVTPAGGRDGVTCWDAGERGKDNACITHRHSPEKGRGERKPVRQMEFLIPWDNLSENISFRASPALYTFYIHTGVLWTDCEPAPCLSWFRLPLEGNVPAAYIRH